MHKPRVYWSQLNCISQHNEQGGSYKFNNVPFISTDLPAELQKKVQIIFELKPLALF